MIVALANNVGKQSGMLLQPLTRMGGKRAAAREFNHTAHDIGMNGECQSHQQLCAAYSGQPSCDQVASVIAS